jgi:8-oxo-dGTP pyrophosphatase MutT (NUDIX family)
LYDSRTENATGVTLNGPGHGVVVRFGLVRPLVTDDEIRTLAAKGFGPGRAWALREADKRGLVKDFSAGSPLASGFAPFDLKPGVQSVVPSLATEPRPRKKPKGGKVSKASVNYRPAEGTQKCANCSMFGLKAPDFEAGGCTLVKGIIDPEATCDRWEAKSKAASAAETAAPSVVAAGLAVRAEDTGRVLMLQRANDPEDPYAGAFEFGGGHLEPGETPFAAACREWSEEVGAPCPNGQIVAMWASANGLYEGFVMSIPHESEVAINLDYPRVDNPDAPLHAKPETVVWMSIDDLAGMPALRRELIADLPRVLPALRAPARSDKGTDPRMMGTSIDESEVLEYLQKHYPDADLGWVSRCVWAADNVLLDNINWENRPGGIDEDKVADMADRLSGGWMPHPCVLVAPDAGSKMVVADGYHRCAANAKAGIGVIRAWVGSPKPGATGWMADVLAMQFTATNHGDD